MAMRAENLSFVRDLSKLEFYLNYINVSLVIEIEGPFNGALLEQAWDMAAAKFPYLRMRIYERITAGALPQTTRLSYMLAENKGLQLEERIGLVHIGKL